MLLHHWASIEIQKLSDNLSMSSILRHSPPPPNSPNQPNHARVCLLCFIILLFFALTLPLNQADCRWPTKSFFTNKRKEKTFFSALQVELNGIVLEMHIWALILCCNFSSRQFSYISDWRKTTKNSCCFSWVCALQENKFRSLNGPPDSILVMDYL